MKATPYFLENEDWYIETVDDSGYVSYELTDKAPELARESFDEYYSDPVFIDENGDEIDFSGYAIHA